jgi:hypothetical protein
MGGRLFDLPRMPRADYLEREAAIRAYLDEKLAGAYRIPRYIGDKADFGDMDVIVASRPDWGDVRAEIARELGIERTKIVGHVFSTVFRELQTDFFAVPAAFVDSTADFMSFNDLGNLLGRICRRFDLKYGERGLEYVFRRDGDDHYKAELPVTLDFAQTCAFLGLDHAAWVRGFDTLPAMFDWVIASPYFSVVPYLDDPDGTIGRRSRDRPTIVAFIAYLRERGIANRPAFADRKSYVAQIAAAFPAAELEQQIAGERAKETRARAIAERFNGVLVMRLRPELAGAALGQFIVAFKKSVPDWEAFVLDTPPDAIEQQIRDFVPPLP